MDQESPQGSGRRKKVAWPVTLQSVVHVYGEAVVRQACLETLGFPIEMVTRKFEEMKLSDALKVRARAHELGESDNGNAV